jgi:hypothetical protein
MGSGISMFRGSNAKEIPDQNDGRVATRAKPLLRVRHQAQLKTDQYVAGTLLRPEKLRMPAGCSNSHTKKS